MTWHLFAGFVLGVGIAAAIFYMGMEIGKSKGGKKLKPWTPGTTEKYRYRVTFFINGMLTYMDIPAEDKEDARKEMLEIYKNNLEEFEIVEIECRL